MTSDLAGIVKPLRNSFVGIWHACAMSDTPKQPPAGWYPDPAGGQGERFWDGEAWSQSTRDRVQPESQGGVPTVDPRLAPYAGGPAQGSGQPYPGGTARMVPAQGGFALATFWWRVLGYLIDSIILLLPSTLLTGALSERAQSGLELYLNRLLLAGFDGGDLPPLSGALVWDLFLLFLIPMVLWGVYRTVTLGFMQATLGQRLCGLRVAKLGDEQLEPIGWRTAVIRGFGGAVLFQLISFFAVITVLFTDRRQTVADLLSKTVVVNTREAV